jgi:predicted molibdopterin-dependent oxidoreductase YjgC
VSSAGPDAAAVQPAAGGDPTLSGAGDMLPPGDEGEIAATETDVPAVALPDWELGEPPMVDAFSLRLVASRKLYDQGTLVRHSPSLVGLAEGAAVRLNPYDFQKLGVPAGDEVRVASGRTHVLVPVRPSDTVPRGLALLHVNQSGGRVNALLETSAGVADVRVERA